MDRIYGNVVGYNIPELLCSRNDMEDWSDTTIRTVYSLAHIAADCALMAIIGFLVPVFTLLFLVLFIPIVGLPILSLIMAGFLIGKD